MNKIGVFGGTFNPIHKGHESMAEEFYNKCGLDKLLVIPSNIPPHKKNDENVTPFMRYEMCEVCFDCDKYKGYNIEVSDIEIKKDGVSYTFDTVKMLREIYSGDLIYFLVGSDMFLYLEHWRNYRELLEMCVFTVAFRNRNEKEINEVIKQRDDLKNRGYTVELLDNIVFEISSTELREKIKKRDFDYLNCYLSPEVLNYIKERNMYVLQ